jgi:hypothetical protein
MYTPIPLMPEYIHSCVRPIPALAPFGACRSEGERERMTANDKRVLTRLLYRAPAPAFIDGIAAFIVSDTYPERTVAILPNMSGQTLVEKVIRFDIHLAPPDTV